MATHFLVTQTTGANTFHQVCAVGRVLDRGAACLMFAQWVCGGAGTSSHLSPAQGVLPAVPSPSRVPLASLEVSDPSPPSAHRLCLQLPLAILRP